MRLDKTLAVLKVLGLELQLIRGKSMLSVAHELSKK